MVYAVEITISAERDLEELYAYVSAAGSEAAQQWFDDLGAAIRSLKANPERGPQAGTGVRQLVYGRRRGRYRILYEIDTGQARVMILSIRHGARQWLEVGS